MKIKVSAEYSGVLPTGPYKNEKPGFSAEIEYDDLGSITQSVRDEFVKNAQKSLFEVCYSNFKDVERKSNIERIQREREDLWIDEEGPHVSSIIGWDDDYFLPPHELQQYASQGNLIDLQSKHFIEKHVWTPIDDLEAAYPDLVIIRRGNLRLPTDGWNFPAFLEKYPTEKMEIGKRLVSKEHRFVGTPDIRKCIYDGKKTLADIKRTAIKEKHFKQCAAYVMLEEENGEEPYEQLMLIPLSDKTRQGFSKPMITDKIAYYKKLFLDDRKNFRRRFGV